MKEFNDLLARAAKTMDLLDNLDDDFPSSWPKNLKEIVRIAVKGNKITEKERQFLHTKGAEANISPDEIDIVVDRLIASQLEEEKLFSDIDKLDDDDLDEDLPAEFKKYMPIIEALEDDNIPGAVIAGLKCFAPLLIVCLAVIIICFFIKWWIGLLSILGVIVFLCFKVYSIYTKLEDL